MQTKYVRRGHDDDEGHIASLLATVGQNIG